MGVWGVLAHDPPHPARMVTVATVSPHALEPATTAGVRGSPSKKRDSRTAPKRREIRGIVHVIGTLQTHVETIEQSSETDLAKRHQPLTSIRASVPSRRPPSSERSSTCAMPR